MHSPFWLDRTLRPTRSVCQTLNMSCGSLVTYNGCRTHGTSLGCTPLWDKRKLMTAQLSEHEGGIRIVPVGDAALLAEFGTTVDPDVNERVLSLDRVLALSAMNSDGHSAILETVPTYRSLLIHYDPLIADFATLADVVRRLSLRPLTAAAASRHWRIPVVYGGEFGIDLADVAKRAEMSEDEVVRRHTAVTYRVYMLGFLPGFSYLGGLDPKIATPRRDDPRLITPSGTISIGGIQAGIQCLEGPSGWHLLGRTPVRTYHPTRDPMFLIEPGDRVSFFQLPASEWRSLDQSAADGALVAEQVS
jgi:5-oxoprolinase (ATP-hydrolysing) subunit B